MPTYQYVCIECDLSQDLKRHVDDRDNPVMCEKCGYVMKRTFNASPIQFKGSGFYSTGG
jgi:putative FmdB family regulatory protein